MVDFIVILGRILPSEVSFVNPHSQKVTILSQTQVLLAQWHLWGTQLWCIMRSTYKGYYYSPQKCSIDTGVRFLPSHCFSLTGLLWECCLSPQRHDTQVSKHTSPKSLRVIVTHHQTAPLIWITLQPWPSHKSLIKSPHSMKRCKETLKWWSTSLRVSWAEMWHLQRSIKSTLSWRQYNDTYRT